MGTAKASKDCGSLGRGSLDPTRTASAVRYYPAASSSQGKGWIAWYSRPLVRGHVPGQRTRYFIVSLPSLKPFWWVLAEVLEDKEGRCLWEAAWGVGARG